MQGFAARQFADNFVSLIAERGFAQETRFSVLV